MLFILFGVVYKKKGDSPMNEANDTSTHYVPFPNLVDSNTGKTVRIEVPNTLRYEGGVLYAGFLGRQAGEKIRKLLTEKK